jgi:DNA end-binding protein Ku
MEKTKKVGIARVVMWNKEYLAALRPLDNALVMETMHFSTLHDQDKVPLKQTMFCPADGKEVHPQHMVKGFEIEKDRFVIIRQDELEAAAPKSSKAIEIQDFVELDEIDPLYFDRPYYVAPKPAGAKPYKLLLEAMEKTKKVGIARVVMWNKEYLAALRPLDNALVMETMHFSDEVVPASHVGGLEVKSKVDERELKMAQQLIDTLSGKWNPDKYHDEYREQVMQLIERKAAGEEVVTRPAEEKEHKGRGVNLMAALEASLAKSRGEESAAGPRHRAPRAHGRSTTTRRRRSS